MVSPGVSVAHFIHYPESDGKPMAETEIHGDIIEDVKYKLSQRYRDEPMVHVGGNLLMYYVEGDPTQNVAPDVYVTFGMDKARRRIYKVWVERRPPDVIFEITSDSSKYQDIGTKKGVYEALGVREYFLVDPLGDYLDPPLRGFRLNEQGQYQPIKGPVLESEVLGLRIAWSRGQVSLTDSETGKVLLSSDQEAQRAAQEAQRAAQAEENEQKERRAREEAERQLQELKAKLEALEGKG